MQPTIKAIIGLGNPGPKYYYTRHSIGFRILDAFAQAHNLDWQTKGNLELSQLERDDKTIWLLKPQTFMNDSGKVIPFLQLKGIKPEEMLVIHDELELPFGEIKMKFGGSARGHNGLKSIIATCGDQFMRLRFGIGRPEDRNEVADYVLQKFKDTQNVQPMIDQAVEQIEQLI